MIGGQLFRKLGGRPVDFFGFWLVKITNICETNIFIGEDMGQLSNLHIAKISFV